MSESKVKTKFLKPYQTQEADPQSYEEGKTYDLPESSALHFERRGYSERVASPKGSGKPESTAAKKSDKDAESDK